MFSYYLLPITYYLLAITKLPRVPYLFVCLHTYLSTFLAFIQQRNKIDGVAINEEKVEEEKGT